MGLKNIKLNFAQRNKKHLKKVQMFFGIKKSLSKNFKKLIHTHKKIYMDFMAK